MQRLLCGLAAFAPLSSAALTEAEPNTSSGQDTHLATNMAID